MIPSQSTYIGKLPRTLPQRPSTQVDCVYRNSQANLSAGSRTGATTAANPRDIRKACGMTISFASILWFSLCQLVVRKVSQDAVARVGMRRPAKSWELEYGLLLRNWFILNLHVHHGKATPVELVFFRTLFGKHMSSRRQLSVPIIGGLQSLLLATDCQALLPNWIDRAMAGATLPSGRIIVIPSNGT